jgi:hypothetical protein
MKSFSLFLLYVVLLFGCSSLWSTKAIAATNEPFQKAIAIIKTIDFNYYSDVFAKWRSLSPEKKKEINDTIKPLCRNSISLLRRVYKLDPKNPDINAELVHMLFFDFVRIACIGTFSEGMQAVNTGFQDENGAWVSGYPDMIEYHAKRCRENDRTHKYSKMLNAILDELKSKSADRPSSLNQLTPFAQLLSFKSRDGRAPLLASLYGRQLDTLSVKDRRILENLLKQIRTDSNQYGVALDVDRLKLVYGKAPLVCRNLEDLEVVLQNQLEIYVKGKAVIVELWGLNPYGTYENDPLLRQVIADYEGKILTPFRTKGIRLNLKTNEMEWVDLQVTSVEQEIDMIVKQLEMRGRLGIKPGPSDYDLSDIDPSFVPTAGYNIL